MEPPGAFALQQFVLNDRWLFDPVRWRITDLSGRRDALPLPPVTSRILVLLAQAPYAVLSRRQLIEDGWRAFGFEVTENSLSQVIHTLRSAFLTMDPPRPFIRTLPRIGYTLLAQVRPSGGPGAAPLPDRPTRAAAEAQPLPDTQGTPPVMVIVSPFASSESGLAAHRIAVEKPGGPRSLLLIDIDQLRAVSDLSGAIAKEDLLSAVEKLIGLQLHYPGGHLVRHTSASFAVRLQDMDLPEAAHVAQRISAAVLTLDWRSPRGMALPVTVSIGLVWTAVPGLGHATAFLMAAVAALYQAKRGGGNRIVSRSMTP